MRSVPRHVLGNTKVSFSLCHNIPGEVAVAWKTKNVVKGTVLEVVMMFREMNSNDNHSESP